MSRTAPRIVFGVHGVTPYNRDTGLPYGELRVLHGSSIAMSAELVDQMGGSSKYPWAAEEGAISAEMTLSLGQLEDFMFELFLGSAPTENNAETSGNVGTLANHQGSSVQGAANAITSVSLLTGSSANLKFGKYIISAVTASQFDLYYMTGIDLGRGTNGSFLTDSLKVASSVAFTSSVASVPAFGLQFNQNGTLAFTTGDTAEFYVRPINTASASGTVGAIADQVFPEFGALVYAQKNSRQQMIELDVFRCKAAGMPLPFERAQFAKFEIKVKLLYDQDKYKLFDWRFCDAQ